MDSDRDLVGRLVAGDAAAWSEFGRRYIRQVVHVVRETLVQKTGRAGDEDVDDVTEEVYAHICDRNFRVLQNLREPYNLKAWIAVSARRKALDHAKRRGLRAVSLDQPAGDDPRSSPLERLIGRPQASPDEAEEIRRALEQSPLNPKERLLITLFYFRDQNYAEISDVMGIPENSIGPTLRRALEKLKETLRQRGLAR
jgi:RNA polymerase sigma-70 factor (ECF subfamily)